jgi:hypothetical protein
MKYYKQIHTGRIEHIDHIDTIKRLLTDKDWVEIPEPIEETKLQDLVEDEIKLSDLIIPEQVVTKRTRKQRGKNSEHINNISG